MAYGILSAGQRDLDITEALARQAVGREYQRNQLKQQLENKEDAERNQAVGMGGGLGLRYGMSDAGKQSIDDLFGYGEMPDEAGTAIDVGTVSEPVTGGLGSAAEVGTIAEPIAADSAMGLTSSVAPKVAKTAATTAATDAASTAATTAATDAATTAATSAATEAATTAGTTAAGAESLGAMAGPIGMIGGAVLGYALNELF
ncbi:hypothetical protein K1B37_000962 [Vibrio parahaemolyticus]|nr:hypothetical protein [Vibrio parahaemolyticus]